MWKIFSIAMTATTSILALGTMPLWLFIYSKVSAPDKDLVIPFDSLGLYYVVFNILWI